MAISRTLNIATSLPVTTVASELHQLALDIGLLVEPTSDAAILQGVVTASGTWLQMVEATHSPRNPVTIRFGIEPTILVTFEYDKFGDFELQANDLVQLVSGLLDRISGDLVLHSDYEIIWLVRVGDELTVNDRDDVWPVDRLALLKGPYDRRPLTFSGIPG